MQKLVIDQSTRLILTTAKTGITSGTISLIDGQGNFVKTSADADIDDLAVTGLGPPVFVDLQVNVVTSSGFYRAFWKMDDGNPVVLEESNYPEDIRIHAAQPSVEELVPLAYLTENFLENIDLGTFSRDGIRDILQASRGELEQDTQMYFTKRVIVDETHDWYLQQFRQEFWMQQLRHWPIDSVEKMVIKYNDNVIATLDLSWIKIESEIGTIEVLPYAQGQSGFLWSILMSGLSGLGISIFGALFERIPTFFHIDYTAGLDFFTMPFDEQNHIRFAVARRAAINLLPKLDTKMGISAESSSIDGVSESVSLTSSAMYGQYSAQIEGYKKEDAEWVKLFRRRYAKDAVMSIA